MYPRDLPALTATPTPLALPFGNQDFGPAPGMSSSQVASILWAYRKQTLLIAGAVVFAAAIACWLWPRTYEAQATLMVDFEVNDPLAGREFPTGLLGSYMATQVELARGSEVLLPVIERLDLVHNKDYAAGYSGPAAGLRTWIETRVRKNLTVEQGRFGSQLIYVTYAASSPVEAAQVANAVADVYAETQYKRLTGPANERAKRYTEQIVELKDKVARAQEQVTEFRKRSGLIGSDAKTDVDMHSIMIQTLKPQLALQTSRLAELRATFGPRHPQVLELEAQMGATRQSLDAELKAYSARAGAELDGAKYQLELESAQSVYKRALEGYDQVKFASAGGYTNVNFVSRAAPPPRASKPKVGIALLVACFAGLGLGICLPLFYELLLNRRVRCRDDVERDHGIPVLVELGPITGSANGPAQIAA